MDLDYRIIFETVGPSLYRLAFSFVNNRSDAEDVIQEVFLRLLQTKRRFDDEDSLKRWLMTVTANRCKDLMRSARWRKEVSVEPTKLEYSKPTNQDDKLDVGAAIFQLDEKYRIVVYLYYYEGYATKEISKILHISQSAVLSRLERARNRLKQLLGGEWLDG